MTDNPITTLISFAVGSYFLWIWFTDYKRKESNSDIATDRLLPGTSKTHVKGCISASIGALLIIIGITITENLTGIANQQTHIPFIFLFAMLGAAITEEIIFRGYLVITHKGKTALIGSAITFSLLFALLHPYIWTHSIESPQGLQLLTQLRLNLTFYSIFSTANIALLSLWFYYVRFAKWNPTHSLIPCFFAHATANIAVFIIKLAYGYVS